MSWELTRFVLSLPNLTPTEKAVAHSLAYHATKNGPAYPSMKTIASESGIKRRAAQTVVRQLETKEIIYPVGSKKGGRNNPTRYLFNVENSIPQDALSAAKGAATCALSQSVKGAERCTQNAERVQKDVLKGAATCARDSRDRKAVDSTESTATPISQEQMEKKLDAVWNYYLAAFDKEESFSNSAKRFGREIISEIVKSYPGNDPVFDMSCVIDMAHHIVKHNPKKAYLSGWYQIFGKWDLFLSLHQQYVRTDDVPEAATFKTNT